MYTTSEPLAAYFCADSAFNQIMYTESAGSAPSHAGSPGPWTVGCHRTGRLPARTTAAAETFAVYSACSLEKAAGLRSP